MNDYRCRVQVAYDRLIDNRPDAINNVRAAAGAAPADIKKEGINDMALFFKHQLFLAGIKEPIQDKVLEPCKATFQESMKLSRELEAIHNDKKRTHKISAIKAAISPEEAANIFWDEIADEDLDKVATVRQNRAPHPPPRSTPAAAPTVNAARLRSNGPRNPNVVCRFCKKKGHMQRECNSHRRDGALMVDANGKKYESRVNNIAEKDDSVDQARPQYEDAHIGAVANLSPYHHLNW
jgi:hypothetical protein